MRINKSSASLPLVKREKSLKVIINGKITQAFEGELISTVLQAEGISILNHKHKTGRASGVYCAMGICYECLVTVDSVPNIRACQTLVKDQMVIETSIRENHA